MASDKIFLEMKDIFAPGGALAKCFSGYEYRHEQAEMAEAVQGSLLGGRHLVVEAGTGVGKSFAYLVPAMDMAARKAGKALVSTFTITLQEQLINKDIPFLTRLKGVVPAGFTAVLAKGRGNYLCRRRLEFALRRQMGLFDDFGSALCAIRDWAGQTEDGSLSDLHFVPKGQVWDAVRSEHGNCRGRKCPYFPKCFYWRARRGLETADVIVANHALLFSDLVLREEGTSILPDYKWVIIDEAHNMEHVAEEHFGIQINSSAVRFLLDGLYNPRSHRGFLAGADSDDLVDAVVGAGEEARRFFRNIREWYEKTKNDNNGRCQKNFVEDNLSGYIQRVRAGLLSRAKQAGDDDEKSELTRYADKCTALMKDLQDFLIQTKEGHVYWVEVGEGGRGTVVLRSAAVDVGPDVKRCLFDKFGSVIMTSATLSSGGASEGDEFGFFAGRIGLAKYDGVRIGSPYDYERQVKIYIEKDLPDPNTDDFVEKASEAVKRYIQQTQGRAFLLFTSYQMLEKFSEYLGGWLGENDIELLQQGVGVDRSALLTQFKRDNRSVLFGTDSFWQGVDVAGEALSNVIIVRLPFAVPDTPLLAGRLEKIRENGGNPFVEYQLPSAIIKFKQGFGRLIRSKTDTGIIVILDSRVLNKSYGQKFLSAIPKCRTEIVARRS